MQLENQKFWGLNFIIKHWYLPVSFHNSRLVLFVHLKLRGSRSFSRLVVTLLVCCQGAIVDFSSSFSSSFIFYFMLLFVLLAIMVMCD